MNILSGLLVGFVGLLVLIGLLDICIKSDKASEEYKKELGLR